MFGMRKETMLTTSFHESGTLLSRTFLQEKRAGD